MSHTRIATGCVGAVLACLAAGAGASTPEAWEQAEKAAVQACLQASGLAQPSVAGKPVVFDDASGQTAVVVHGRYPQPHMGGAQGRVLCLYDRVSGLAHVAEWPLPEAGEGARQAPRTR